MKGANYTVSLETQSYVLIIDLGPWDVYPTITNDAENVVRDMFPKLKGRKLYYEDSEGIVDELLIEDGKFIGFSPVTERERPATSMASNVPLPRVSTPRDEYAFINAFRKVNPTWRH